MAERDVELVIRARDEANKVVKNFTAGLRDLVGVQDDMSKSAGKIDNVLSRLGAEFTTLNTQVQGLKAFGRVVSDMDRAAAAVDRLDSKVALMNGELAQLAAKQQAAAAATLQAKAAAEQAAAAFDQQSKKAAEVRKEVGATADAYKAEKVALDAAREARAAANQTVTRAAAEERKLQAAMNSVSSDLENQKISLAAASTAWQELYTASQRVGTSLGGVAASQEEIARAADRAAEKLNLAKGAIDFTREAAEAKRLRDAAEYVDFWTQALGRKEAAERAAGAADAEVQKFRDIAVAARNAAEAEQEYRRINAALGVGGSGKSARDSAAVFEEAARAEDQMAAAAARLRRELDPLVAVNDKLSQELREIEGLYKSGRISQVEYTNASKLVGQRADDAAQALGRMNAAGGKGTLFGLRPYELHSLSYQVNDVFTQLGSGTPVMQVLAQQGGQVFQVFQRQLVPAISRVGPALATVSPFLVVIAAAIGTVAAALKNVADEASSVKQFGAALAASADGAKYNAKTMADAAHQIDVYGGSLEDARKAVKAFNAAGIDQSQFVRFGKTAQDLADVTGIALPEAAKKLAEGFSGGWKQVDELDKSLNFLTASEYANLKAKAENGQTTEALIEAYAILERRQSEAAQRMRGPWSEATRNLGRAWDGFLDSIGNSKPITAAISALSDLLKLIKRATDLLPGGESLPELLAQRAKLQAETTRLQGSFLGNIQTSPFGNSSPAQIAAKQLAELDAQIAKKRLEEAAKLNGIRAEDREDTGKADLRALEAARKKLELAKGLSDEARVKAAYDEASLAASNDGASKAAAAEVGRLAAATERLKIEKENSKEAAKQLKDATDLDKIQGQAFLSTAMQFNGRSENNAADNNVLQNLFKQAGQDVDPKMTAWCAAFVNAVLATNNLPGTGKLNARSFLNYGKEASTPQAGDIVVLKRGSNPDQGHVGFFQGFDDKGNVKVLGGNQGDKVGTDTFPASDVLSYRRAPTPADVYKQAAKDADELAAKQAALNLSIGEFVAKGEIDNAIAAARLAKNEALVRELTIEREVKEQIASAEKQKLTLSEAQIEAIRATATASYDLGNQERLQAQQQAAAEQPVNDLMERRRLLQEQITFAQQQGDNGTAERLKAQLTGVNAELQTAIDRAIAMWKAIGGPEADNAILKLQGAKAEVKAVGDKVVITGQQANEMIATGLTGAFDSFAKAVANGENAFDAAGDAFRQFAADFLRQIAQMILKQAILNMLGAGAGGGGGVGGIIASTVAGLFHEGGIVGQGGQARAVSPSWFANAARYHTGGIVGLKPNEVPAVLQKNEEVLTESDPRHQFNGGGMGGTVVPAPQIKIVNAIDAGDMVQQGLNTSVGEKAILNLVRNNPGAFKQAMGG